MRTRSHPQSGMALTVALIFVVVLTLVALSAIRFSSMGLRSSLNEELRVEARQHAQSVADAITSDPNSTPVYGLAGSRFCTPGIADCTTNDLALPDNAYDTEIGNGKVTAVVERLAPTFSPPPLGYSARCFQSARFGIEGNFDGTDDGQSRTTIHQGLVLPVLTGAC